jgi:hypothetical protein
MDMMAINADPKRDVTVLTHNNVDQKSASRYAVDKDANLHSRNLPTTMCSQRTPYGWAAHRRTRAHIHIRAQTSTTRRCVIGPVFIDITGEPTRNSYRPILPDDG